MQREFYPNIDDGFRERFITPAGARPSLPAECSFVRISNFHRAIRESMGYVTIRRC